ASAGGGSIASAPAAAPHGTVAAASGTDLPRPGTGATNDQGPQVGVASTAGARQHADESSPDAAAASGAPKGVGAGPLATASSAVNGGSGPGRLDLSAGPVRPDAKPTDRPFAIGPPAAGGGQGSPLR